MNAKGRLNAKFYNLEAAMGDILDATSQFKEYVASSQDIGLQLDVERLLTKLQVAAELIEQAERDVPYINRFLMTLE